jgi:DMSO/TMAO reductase YedYZ molybdopterin-dependent catalytic subunit
MRNLFLPPLPLDQEREAFLGLAPAGFHFRPPLPPEALINFLTTDDELFETIHMGAAIVDEKLWQLKVDGLVKNAFSINLEILKALPKHSITAFHECYGSPLKLPTEPMRRIGNVTWTGVRLNTLLDYAQVSEEARYVWSEGLDRGEFAGKKMDRYQKDLPIEKAISNEVILAYEINGAPLRRERGGPVRLVVPGWFGTNMTKWISRLSAQKNRASGPFTTDWYNEDRTEGGVTVRHPVWKVAPNSIIVEPAPNTLLTSEFVTVRGWAWGESEIVAVDISADHGETWVSCDVYKRKEFEWQAYAGLIRLKNRQSEIIAKATSKNGSVQPTASWRNSVSSTSVRYEG